MGLLEHIEKQGFLATVVQVAVPMSFLSSLAMILAVLISITPAGLTKHISFVDWIRSWCRAKMFYYWQLSLEGPLFKAIGACGRRFGRGRLASKCRTPKAFKVKVCSCSEIDVAWTPQPPANPFHEEHYIISYCLVGTDGKVGDWHEREMKEEDYFKKEKEKPKEIGKSERKRLKIAELPDRTKFRIRVCADGPGGRSPWSTEVCDATYAKPDEKTNGLKGPLAKDSPTEVREYEWWQTKHEVGLTFAIPADWRGKQINVKVLPRSEGTEIKMLHEKGALLTGVLGGPVRKDEIDWTIEDADNGGKELRLTLHKEKLMQKWECFIEGHQRVDPELLKLIYEGNSMTELSSPDLWE
jgi:hypothetical protein